MTLALLLAASASAQTVAGGSLPALDAQLLRPSSAAGTMIAVDDTRSADLGWASARFLAGWANDPLVYRYASGETRHLLGHLAHADLLGAVHVGPLRFGVHLPVVMRAVGDLTGGETGLGDVGVDVRGSFLQRDRDPLGVGLAARLTLPTSTLDGPLGSGGFSGDLTAVVDGRIGGLVLAANIGARVQPVVEVEGGTWGHQLLWRAGASYDLTSDAGLSLELLGQTPFASAFRPGMAPMETLLGAWYDLPGLPLAIHGGAGAGLSRGIGAPRARALLGLTWTPERRADTDRDGVADRLDACPGEAEDADGWEDLDGCPDPTEVTLAFVNPLGDPIEQVEVKLGSERMSAGVDGALFRIEAGEHRIVAVSRSFDTRRDVVVVPPGPPITLPVSLSWGMPCVLVVQAQDPLGQPVLGTWGIGDGPQAWTGQALPVACGVLEVTVAALGFDSRTHPVQVYPGDPVQFMAELVPEAVPGILAIEVVDSVGRPLDAAVVISDGQRFDVPGRVVQAVVGPGELQIEVGASGYQPDVRTLVLHAGEELSLRVQLERSVVELSGRQIQLSQPVAFEPGSAELAMGGASSLARVATVLAEHDEIALLRIEGHGAPGDPPGLSQARADAAQRELVARGVDAARLIAFGLGEVQLDDASPGGVEFFVEAWASEFAVSDAEPATEELRQRSVREEILTGRDARRAVRRALREQRRDDGGGR